MRILLFETRMSFLDILEETGSLRQVPQTSCRQCFVSEHRCKYLLRFKSGLSCLMPTI